jgi:hypothetical protein
MFEHRGCLVFDVVAVVDKPASDVDGAARPNDGRKWNGLGGTIGYLSPRSRILTNMQSVCQVRAALVVMSGGEKQ